MPNDAELVTAFRQAVNAHERAQRNVAAAEEAVGQARAALSAQLVPAGAKIGDRFGVYVDNDLVQIEVTSSEPRVTVMKNVKPFVQ